MKKLFNKQFGVAAIATLVALLSMLSVITMSASASPLSPGQADNSLVALNSGVLPAVPALGATWVSCTPTEVMVYTASPRLHVRCAQAVGNIRYFAVSTSDAANASRVLSTISTATVAGRTLTILYDPNDKSGASLGCQENDCRLIKAVGFGQ